MLAGRVMSALGILVLKRIIWGRDCQQPSLVVSLPPKSGLKKMSCRILEVSEDALPAN